MIDSNMELYLWGSNKKGQLGLESEQKLFLKPKKAMLSDQIIKVKCGYRNTLILTKDFEVMVCGDNSGNSVSIEKLSQVNLFVKVDNLPEVEKIFCSNFFAVLTKDQCIYVWGNSDLWQFSQPCLLEEFRNQALDVSIGNDFIVVIDFNFLIYSAGKNDKGQLGYENTIENLEFKCIEKLSSSPIKSIVCGADFCLGISGINAITQNRYLRETQMFAEETDKSENRMTKSVNIFQNSNRLSSVSQNFSQLQSPGFANFARSQDVPNRNLAFSGKGGNSYNPSPQNRNGFRRSDLPLIYETDREEARVINTETHTGIILNKRSQREVVDFSAEIRELAKIEREFNEKITPKQFQNMYADKISEMRVC